MLLRYPLLEHHHPRSICRSRKATRCQDLTVDHPQTRHQTPSLAGQTPFAPPQSNSSLLLPVRMCTAERTTYLDSAGRQRTSETTTKCHRASGSYLCNSVTLKSVDSTSRTGQRYSRLFDDAVVTMDRDSLSKAYGVVSKPSSKDSSLRRSNAASSDSAASVASSTSSPPGVPFMPPAPSPPPPLCGPFPGERSRAPYPPRSSSSAKDATLLGRTAGYQPAARHPVLKPSRESHATRSSSPSSTIAEVNDVEPAVSALGPSWSDVITSATRTSSDSPASPSRKSSRPSRRQQIVSGRHDSATALAPRSSRPAGKQRTDRDSSDDRQLTSLERERVARSERRQSARERLVRDASRERHRMDAAEALEGGRSHSIRPESGAEYVARDRATVKALRRSQEAAQLYMDSRARRSSTLATRPPSLSMTRESSGIYLGPPHSARSPTSSTMDQYPSGRRSRAGTERLDRAFNNISLQERVLEDEYVSAGCRSETSRRSGRQGRVIFEETVKPRRFWR